MVEPAEITRLFGESALFAADSARPISAKIWSRDDLSGRISELCGEALLTAAFGLVLDAQKRGEPVAWVTQSCAGFYPPDAAEGGVDLDALVVVRLPRADDLPRAADKLIKSGAFGLVVIDLSHDRPTTDTAHILSRLLGSARKLDTAVVLLADRRSPMGSLVSLRCEARRIISQRERSYSVEMRALKDKRRGPGCAREEICRAPAGLR